MLKYILWRVAVMMPTLLIISILVFAIIELPPGDYFESYIAEIKAQGEGVNLDQIEALRAEYGFDQPLIYRYLYWVTGMLQGDFGYSFEYQLPVSEVVGRPAVADYSGFLCHHYLHLDYRLPYRHVFRHASVQLQ